MQVASGRSNKSYWKFYDLCHCLHIFSAHIVLILSIHQKLSEVASCVVSDGIGKQEDNACKVIFGFPNLKKRVDFFKFESPTSLKITLYESRYIIPVRSDAAWRHEIFSDSGHNIPKLNQSCAWNRRWHSSFKARAPVCQHMYVSHKKVSEIKLVT